MSESKEQRNTQSRGWIVTLPADRYTRDDIMTKFANYTFEGQREIGADSGFDHWQLWIENATPIAFSTLRNKFPEGHFEMRRGTKQEAHAYVTKTETSTGETISKGELDLEDRRGTRNDLSKARDAVLAGASVDHVITSVPGAWRHARSLRDLRDAALADKFSASERDVTVHYIHGEPGVGKTRMIFDRHRYRDVYRVNSYRNPFDRYDSQSVIVLDEFYGQLNMEFMLNLLDRYPLTLPARYSDKTAAFTEVYLISNIPLTDQYLEIQSQNPAQWRAFLRRIDSVERMEEGGHLVDDSASVASVF